MNNNVEPFLDLLFTNILDYTLGRYIAFLFRLLIIIILPILIFKYVRNKKWTLKSLFLYYLIFIFIFEKTFSIFMLDLVELPNHFSYNSNIGVAWVIIVPVNFIVFILIGIIFDYIKNKKLID